MRGELWASPLQFPISKPEKVQQFQFQTSEILLFTVVQKLYGLEVSRFVPCMLQVLDSFRQLFIFSNYIGKIDHFTLGLLTLSLHLLKSFLLWIIQTKTTVNESLNVRLQTEFWTNWKSLKQEKHHISDPHLNIIV